MTAGRGAHEDLHLQYLAVLLLDERGDQIEIAIIDPGLQKSRRDREAHDAFRH